MWPRGPTISGCCAAGLVLPACTQIEKVEGGMSGGSVPTEVQRAFNESCALGGCHDAASRQAGLDLSASGSPAIIGGMSSQSDLPLVELGNVQGSYLALKMLPSPPSGSLMPIGEPPGVDNPTNIAIILGWIAGATLPGGGGGGSDGGSTTADPTTAGTADASSGGDSTQLCGVADVAPSAPNPFDSGTAAGQIPSDVGQVLSNNCGCHETDPADLTMGAPPYGGLVHFSTLEEIQGDYMVGMTPRPVVEALLERVQDEGALRMPPAYFCDLGDGSTILDADRQLLIDWLMAGAPDAPTWMP